MLYSILDATVQKTREESVLRDFQVQFLPTGLPPLYTIDDNGIGE